MQFKPPKMVEAIVALVVPPACREEVMGDLHERCKTRLQYIADVLSTVPLVIWSRFRRIADLQTLVIQAFALYISFMAAALLNDRTILTTEWGPLRLALSAAVALLGLILDDIYATRGRPLSAAVTRGPLLAFLMALASQTLLRIVHPDLALPRWVALNGCAMSLLLSSAIRMWFPPFMDQVLTTNTAVSWLKSAITAAQRPDRVLPRFRSIATLIMFLIACWWLYTRT